MGGEVGPESIRSHLPHHPALALELLARLDNEAARRSLATVIAQSWARQDITAAWHAVSRSPLSAADMQLMFNELWG